MFVERKSDGGRVRENIIAKNIYAKNIFKKYLCQILKKGGGKATLAAPQGLG